MCVKECLRHFDPHNIYLVFQVSLLLTKYRCKPLQRHTRFTSPFEKDSEPSLVFWVKISGILRLRNVRGTHIISISSNPKTKYETDLIRLPLVPQSYHVPSKLILLPVQFRSVILKKISTSSHSRYKLTSKVDQQVQRQQVGKWGSNHVG